MTPLRALAFIAAVVSAACGTDGTGPTIPLVGTWDLVGFTDGGVAAVTTGTWTFAADSSFTVTGTVTFPGEPTDSLVISGSYSQHGGRVQLTIGAETATWTLTGGGAQVVLTQVEPPPAPPANTITLRRR